MLQFGSIESGMFPTDQSWDAATDLDAPNLFTDFGEQSPGRDSLLPTTNPDQNNIPPSKAVSTVLLYIYSPFPPSIFHPTYNHPQRRRAQNRASQRAFRERKDKHVKGLECQLESLNEKHQDLLCSYNKQGDNIAKLNGKIAALQSHLRTLKRNVSLGEMERVMMGGELLGERSHGQGHGKNVMPESFDAFAFTASSTTNQLSPMLYDGYKLNLDGSVVNAQEPGVAGGTARQSVLPDFEDLLRMP